MADEVADKANGDCQDLISILSSLHTDFLIRKNGDQVRISDLSGKIIILYFSDLQCGPCRWSIPNIISIYNELSTKKDLEMIFVSGDTDQASFNEFFSEMPWLAIPFPDSETRNRLKEIFKLPNVGPWFLIIDQNGKVLFGIEKVFVREQGDIASARKIIREYGVDAYPFTPERIKELKEEVERIKRDQTLRSLLVSSSRNFLISRDGNKVLVSELEGKTVGLYFSSFSVTRCNEFTSKLLKVYKELKENGESFELVLISRDDEDFYRHILDEGVIWMDDDEFFKESFECIPWLALPFKDKSCKKLLRYFKVSDVPILVIIGPDGKTLNPDAVEIVNEFGAEAYPFTPERLAEIKEIHKARFEANPLESILVSRDRDFVIGKDGARVPVSELIGRNILLYFSKSWVPRDRDALHPKLIKAYHEIKEKEGDAFEVIYISSDDDKPSFDKFFSRMPWLALPYGDERKKSLSHIFNVSGDDLPVIIALGPTGRTVIKDAGEILWVHGADAYPFTEEHLKEIEAIFKEMGWPKKLLEHPLHKDHELVLARCKTYMCDGCDDKGNEWSFCCEECDYDLHPKCALEAQKTEEPKDAVEEENSEDDDLERQDSKKEMICDGEFCYRA